MVNAQGMKAEEAERLLPGGGEVAAYWAPGMAVTRAEHQPMPERVRLLKS